MNHRLILLAIFFGAVIIAYVSIRVSTKRINKRWDWIDQFLKRLR